MIDQSPVTSPDTPAVATPQPELMDAAAFRELAQMIGAMIFVLMLGLLGWHAAHYSGAWPY